MAVTTDDIKALREKTGVSVMQCKEALEAAGGDMEQAIAELKKGGAAIAKKKGGRELGAGGVAAYVHAGDTVGALVELRSETDFVARNEEFKKLAREIAMQIAATDTEIVAKKDTSALLEQPYIRDADRTVGDLLQDATQKFGERIEISRFEKYDT